MRNADTPATTGWRLAEARSAGQNDLLGGKLQQGEFDTSGSELKELPKRNGWTGEKK